MKTLLRFVLSATVAIGLVLSTSACGPKTYPTGVEGITARGFDNAIRQELADTDNGGEAYWAWYGGCSLTFYEYPEQGNKVYLVWPSLTGGGAIAFIPDPVAKDLETIIEERNDPDASYTMSVCRLGDGQHKK